LVGLFKCRGVTLRETEHLANMSAECVPRQHSRCSVEPRNYKSTNNTYHNKQQAAHLPESLLQHVTKST